VAADQTLAPAPKHGKMLFAWIWNKATMDSVVESNAENFFSLQFDVGFICRVKVNVLLSPSLLN